MASNSTTQVKRGRGRPSLTPGMVKIAKAARGKQIEVFRGKPATAAQRAIKLAAVEGIQVEVVVMAKHVRPRNRKPATPKA